MPVNSIVGGEVTDGVLGGLGFDEILEFSNLFPGP